ncbi:nuclear receptor coactivator 7 [Aplysia californica]|nr:nuclear receptor coactivator 7 [Aplysia californica]
MPELIQGTSCIITQDHVNQLIRAIPRSMSAGYDWALVFSTKVHGYSLRNLYRQMAVVDDSPCLLFIKDTDNNVFGAYLSDKIKTSETFYGQGSTFLFTFYPEFKKYMWQGDNQFFINGTSDFFAIGSGQGLFGLWVDDNLNHGRSHCCLTFHNDVLTTQEDFRIIDVEAWQFVDCSFS